MEFISGIPLRSQGETEDHSEEERERVSGTNDEILNIDSELHTMLLKEIP